MRGAGDHLSVGERVAFYRRRRGLTQGVLAALVGRSADWLSKVERGDRQIRRLDVLADLAQALRVTLTDLVGQPVLVEDDSRDDNVPAIRDVLMNPRRLSRVLFTAPAQSANLDPGQAGRRVENGWSDYQEGRLGRVITALPELLTVSQQLEDEASASRNGRPHWTVSARAHHLAATTLSKIGEVDLAWIAAERAMHAADQADDPLVLASAARAGTHALLAVGRYDDAMSLGMRAAAWLRERLDEQDPAALSLFGMLHLRSAVAAARHQDRSTAADLLRQAGRAAEQLGVDANYWQTGFGPTNVELHRLSIALDLGDVAYVIENGRAIPVQHMPPERRVCHLIDVGRAMSLVARDAEALDLFLSAETEAATFVRHNPVVRETVRTMHRRAPATGGKSSPLAGLAERCRAIS